MSDAASLFLTDPGAWADPALVAPLISPGLPPETAHRLLSSPRLAARASSWLADRLGRGDLAALPPEDLALAIATAETLDAVALCAGAVWHAPRVRALVLAADLAMLRARLGDEVRDAALRHGALAPAITPPMAADGTAGNADVLAEDIARDGASCMAAWIDALPEWVAARVRLKWQSDTEPPAAPDACADALRIIRALAPTSDGQLQ
jgi:hypothetical protein